MTTQILPVKCPYLNKHYQLSSSSPVCDALLKLENDVPVAVFCNLAVLRGAYGQELETITDEEMAQAEREIPEGGKITCNVTTSSTVSCIYTKTWLKFRRGTYDDNLINH